MNDLNWEDDFYDDYFADLTSSFIPDDLEIMENLTNSFGAYDNLNNFDNLTANELNLCQIDEFEFNSSNEIENYYKNVDLLLNDDLIDHEMNTSDNFYAWTQTYINNGVDLNEKLDEENAKFNDFQVENVKSSSPDIFANSDNENIDSLSGSILSYNNNQCRRNEIIFKIEKLVKMLLQNLVTEGHMALSVPDTSKWINFEMKNGVLNLVQNATERRISTDNSNSTLRFTIIIHLLSEIYEMLINRSSCTLRELYYKDPILFEKQENANNALRDICCYLQVPTWELGVFSSPKGLIAGSLNFILPNNELVDCSEIYHNGILLPLDTASVELLDSNAEFVLIVEKDTVFEKLLRNDILIKITKDIILITGKGYPDLNTRIMINKISKKFQIPIYALMDADPFGIEIMFVYRYGSKGMAYNSEYLTCPKLQWIGIYPSEIDILGIPSIPLTKEDNKKIIELLQRPYLNDDVRKELEIFQKTNKKAEIEAVSSFSLNFLINDYIVNKVKTKLYI